MQETEVNRKVHQWRWWWWWWCTAMWVKFQTHGKPGGLPAADWVSFIKQKQSKVRSQQFDVRGLKKVNHATKISKPAERALSRSSVTLSDVNAARSPSKQHRSVSVHLFKCFGGSITTLASFPSHFFFKNPRQLLSDRTPRLSFLKGKKKPLYGYFEDLFSPPVLSHQRSKIQTLWKPFETRHHCQSAVVALLERQILLSSSEDVFPPHIYKMSISMFLGSWTAAVVVSKIFIKQNQQAGKPTRHHGRAWSPALQNSHFYFLTLMKCSLLSAVRWGQRYKTSQPKLI